MVKRTQAIRRQQMTNYFSVFVHFVGLALKVLKASITSEKKYYLQKLFISLTLYLDMKLVVSNFL